jgi:hypothetical protein
MPERVNRVKIMLASPPLRSYDLMLRRLQVSFIAASSQPGLLFMFCQTTRQVQSP